MAVEPKPLGAVPTSSSPMQRFEEYLQSRGGRITQQQRFILEHVFQEHEHFDAEQLVARLRELPSGGRLGRATVYRVLNKLVEAGLLVRMDLDGRSVYERDYGYPDHDHLFCTQCGRLFEFRSDEIDRLCRIAAGERKFRVRGRRLIVEGQCHDCQQAAVRPRRPQDLL